MHLSPTSLLRRSFPLVFLISAVALWATWRGADSASGGRPLLFVENVGQFAPEVRFQILGLANPAWLTGEALWYGEQRYPLNFDASQGREPQTVTMSYYQGSGRADWRERVPVWGSVLLSGVAPGYDLVLGGSAGGLEWRWKRGGLALLPPPDPLPGWPNDAPTRSATAPSDTALVFGTFLGAELTEEANEIAIAPDGDIVVVGWTSSNVFPGPEAISLHGIDVFIARLSPDGASLNYVLHIYPPDLNAPDYGMAVALDGSGNAYLTGRAESAAYPTTPGAYDETYNGNSDAVVTKVSPDGTLVYSTFLGGDDFDLANDIVVDASGYAYVAGSTWSTDFITNTVGPASARSSFVAKLSPDGSTLEQGVVIGGRGQDEAIALAMQGDLLYAGGWSASSDWPTTPGALQSVFGGAWDGFIIRLDTASLTPTYSSYLGGTDEDRIFGLAIDPIGRPLLTGKTLSADFPTSPGAYDDTLNDGGCPTCSDAFVARLSSSGSALSYSTYLGGAGQDWGTDLLAHAAGTAMVGGHTESADFPTTGDAFATSLAGTQDGFVTILGNGGAGLEYGSFVGGSDWDEVTTLAVQGSTVTLGGWTRSTDFPVSAGAYDSTQNGDADAFVLRLDLAAPPPTETPTPTPSGTPSRTPTVTLGPSPTSTGTPTYTPTATSGPSPTSTGTATPEPSATATLASPSATPTPQGGEVFLPLLVR